MEQVSGAPASVAPAGWHPDPWGQAPLRWWDGSQWTGHTSSGVRVAVPADHHASEKWLLPVGRSPWAIASGYLGIFSILVIFAPFAVITGIVALKDIEAHPEKLGRGRAIFGILAGALVMALVAFAVLT